MNQTPEATEKIKSRLKWFVITEILLTLLAGIILISFID